MPLPATPDDLIYRSAQELPSIYDMTAADITSIVSLIVALVALLVSAAAGYVAWLDYQQVGREEPWALSKVGPGLWLLERVHRKPVFITGYYMSHVAQVDFASQAGVPVGVFRRGTKALLSIPEGNPGELLTIESIPSGKSKWFQGPINHTRGGTAATGATEWLSPTY